jgi:hypothetical protein
MPAPGLPSYSGRSPSGYCTPNANTRCRAMPKIGATYPVGFTASGGAYCIETGMPEPMIFGRRGLEPNPGRELA